jgi:hypothetical protein
VKKNAKFRIKKRRGLKKTAARSIKHKAANSLVRGSKRWRAEDRGRYCPMVMFSASDILSNELSFVKYKRAR